MNLYCRLCLLGLFILLTFFLVGGAVAQGKSIWVTEVVVHEGNVGLLPSLALDSTGHPHIIYYDWSDYSMKHAYYTGSTWQIEVVDSEGVAGTLVLDTNAHLHISYTGNEDNDLKYAYHDGSAWQIETVDEEGNIGDSSLALDTAGHPHISYISYVDADPDEPYYRLKYAYYNGAVWQTQRVDTGVSDTSLALDSENHPHISYYNKADDDLMYAYHDGSSWQVETVDSEGNVGGFNSLALDAAGRPHISYWRRVDDETGNLKYAYYDGVAWQIEVIDSEGFVGYGISLALDAAGHPHIGYIDATGTYDSLKYAYYDGSVWQIEIVDCGQDPSLALDSSGRPHISYYNYTNGDLRYAYRAGPAPLPETGKAPPLSGVLIGAGVLIGLGLALRQWRSRWVGRI